MKHFSILLAFMVTLLSCEKSAKTKEEVNPATTASSGSNSSYGVKYPAPIQKYAAKYCSCYADAAKKASEIVELSFEHQEKLSSSDITCNEKEKLQDEMDAIQDEYSESKGKANDEMRDWNTENLPGSTQGIMEDDGFIFIYERCPKVVLMGDLVNKITTNYRYYDCDPNGSGSKGAMKRDEPTADDAAPDPYYDDYDYWDTAPAAEAPADEGDYDDWYGEEAESDAYYDDYDYWDNATEEASEESYDDWDW